MSGNSWSQLEQLVAERDPHRCELCQRPSATPVCRRCTRALEVERPRRLVRA